MSPAGALIALALAAGSAPQQVVQTEHLQDVQLTEFSPDGAYLASVGDDGTVRIWESATGLMLVSRQVEHYAPHRVSWISDASGLVYSGSPNTPPRLLRLRPGEEAPEVKDSVDGLWSTGAKSPWLSLELDVLSWHGRGGEVLGTAKLGQFPDTVVGSGTAAFAYLTHAREVWRVRTAGAGKLTEKRIGTNAVANRGALALSGDGRTLAFGSGTQVQLFRSEEPGRVLEVGGTFEVQAVALSEDGSRVAAATHEATRVWSSADGVLLWSSGFGGTTLAFQPGGALLAVSQRTQLRFHDARTGAWRSTLGHAVSPPNGLAFLDDSSLVVTSAAGVLHWKLDEARAELIAVPDAHGVLLETDGDWLVAQVPPLTFGRSSPCKPDPATGGAWEVTLRTRRAEPEGDGAGRRKLQLESEPAPRPLPRPRPLTSPLCFADIVRPEDFRDFSRGFLLLRGEKSKRPAVLDLRNGKRIALAPMKAKDAFLNRAWVSLDGRSVMMAHFDGLAVWDLPGGKLRFELQAPGFGNVALALSPDGKQLAVGETGAVATFSIEGAVAKLLAGVQDLGLIPFQLEFTPDGKRVAVVSAEGELRVLEGSTLSAATTASRPDAGYPVLARVSPDGKRVALLMRNGQVQLWELATRTLVASAIAFADGERLITTPAGHYTGTPEAGERITWRFEEPLGLFRFEQFAAAFESPEAVRTSTRGGAVDRPAPPRPPSIALRGPTPAKSSTPSLEVAFKATPGTNPIQRVVAFVEGRARGELVAPIAATASLAVALRGGPETISLVAFDSAGLSSTPLEWKVESPESTAKDRLWIVSAGANYPLLPEALRLPKAAVDAREVAHVLSRHAGPEREFAAVNQTVLVEDEVTGPRLLRAIGRLSQMAPTDVAVVFLAGHGVRLPSGDMVFLTAHTDGSKASIERDSVAWKDLASALGQAKGHVLVILDSCHSGHVSRELLVPNEQLAEAIRSSSGRSLIVYAAAKGEQLSIEEGWNGYFTRALLNALQSRSTDQDGDGWIEVSELLRVVSLVVSVDTAGRQTPWIARKELFGDYRLLRASRW